MKGIFWHNTAKSHPLDYEGVLFRWISTSDIPDACIGYCVEFVDYVGWFHEDGHTCGTTPHYWMRIPPLPKLTKRRHLKR